ncbi:hypothetical protein [Hydrogenibacillus sp. N12]|uniref:hypothetical protein n=1 Tax=Hydrogenibacillus sp. N12 TaxID=2866627 RepID=UPI001C7CC3D7|nr:hypothetical protein [Hydrogenibacillus sp. N12]QZA33570.1 hypothetical protein K2M58_03265 [Hydrogenibacillus sp. N12]
MKGRASARSVLPFRLRSLALLLLAGLVLATGLIPRLDASAHAAAPAGETASPGAEWKLLFKEDFENGTKIGYAKGDVTLPSGTWTLDDALIGPNGSRRPVKNPIVLKENWTHGSNSFHQSKQASLLKKEIQTCGLDD